MLFWVLGSKQENVKKGSCREDKTVDCWAKLPVQSKQKVNETVLLRGQNGERPVHKDRLVGFPYQTRPPKLSFLRTHTGQQK